MHFLQVQNDVGRLHVFEDPAVEYSSSAGEELEIVGSDAKDVLGLAGEFHAAEEDGHDALDGGLVVDFEVLKSGDFLFPEFAAAEGAEVEILIADDDLGFDALHTVGDVVEGAVGESDQDEQQRNRDRDGENAESGSDFSVY